jgi:hypothetical protein
VGYIAWDGGFVFSDFMTTANEDYQRFPSNCENQVRAT